MCDKDDCFLRLFPYSQQLEIHPLTGQGIQRAEGLIHQEQHRILDECPGEDNPLLHAPGQLLGIGLLVT